MMLLDVQKAFDSVNHHILCNKLKAMGVDPTWFRSYLSGRKQCVKTNGETSDFNEIECFTSTEFLSLLHMSRPQ